MAETIILLENQKQAGQLLVIKLQHSIFSDKFIHKGITN